VDDDKKKIALGLKQTQAPIRGRASSRRLRWVRCARAASRASPNSARSSSWRRRRGAGARVTFERRGDRGLGRVGPPEMTGAFEILSIDLEKRRIGVRTRPGRVRCAKEAPSGRRRHRSGRASKEKSSVTRGSAYSCFSPRADGLVPRARPAVDRKRTSHGPSGRDRGRGPRPRGRAVGAPHSPEPPRRSSRLSSAKKSASTPAKGRCAGGWIWVARRQTPRRAQERRAVRAHRDSVVAGSTAPEDCRKSQTEDRSNSARSAPQSCVVTASVAAPSFPTTTSK